MEANSHEWIFGGQTYLCANKFWYLVCFPDFNAHKYPKHISNQTLYGTMTQSYHIHSYKATSLQKICFQTSLCKDHFTHTAARILTWIEAFNRHIQSVQLYSIRSIRFRTKYKSWKQSHRVVNTNAVSNQIPAFKFFQTFTKCPSIFGFMACFFATSPYVEMIC